jgi:hypothetical protein
LDAADDELEETDLALPHAVVAEVVDEQHQVLDDVGRAAFHAGVGSYVV